VPEARRYEGWWFGSFEEGMAAFRALEQKDSAPDVARLADEDETRVSLALAGTGSRAERIGRSYLRLRRRGGGCLAIVGFEGRGGDIAPRRRRSAKVIRGGGGLYLGQRPGMAWERSRFAGPYLRDELLARGVLVETLETAASWSGLPALYGAVREALRGTLTARGAPPVVMCHVSHLYPSGASLYFTFLCRMEPDPLAQWRAAKDAASEAIVGAGGTITHHHAVGRDHAPWLRAEVGDLGIELIRAMKERLDPAGVMNPGKLLPTAE
jgi:alkyldihydroxyacetonephosphate synthase